MQQESRCSLKDDDAGKEDDEERCTLEAGCKGLKESRCSLAGSESMMKQESRCRSLEAGASPASLQDIKRIRRKMKMMQQKQMQPQRAKLSPARALQGASLTDAPLKPESLAEGLKRALCRKADADDDAEALKQERKQGASIFKGLSDDDAADEALKPCKHDEAGKEDDEERCTLEVGCKGLKESRCSLAGSESMMKQESRCRSLEAGASPASLQDIKRIRRKMKMMQQMQMQPQRAKLSPARALQDASLTDAPLKPESLAEGLKRACSRKADADDDAEALKQERKQGASIFKGLSDDDAADEALKPCKHDAAGKQIQMMMHPCRLEALQAPKAGCKALEALAGLMMQMMQQERTYKQERTRYTRYTKSQKSQNIINRPL